MATFGFMLKNSKSNFSTNNKKASHAVFDMHISIMKLVNEADKGYKTTTISNLNAITSDSANYYSLFVLPKD